MRYLVFAYDTYYPAGGWNDFVDFVGSKEEFMQLKAKRGYHNYWEVIDSETWDDVSKEFNNA